MIRARRLPKTAAVASGTGVFVRESAPAPAEAETRPPPASRLPSWAIHDSDTDRKLAQAYADPYAALQEQPE